MHIISDKKLALRFQKNAVSIEERSLYLIGSVCLFLCFSPLIFIFASYFSPSSRWGILIVLSSLTIAIFGIFTCYCSNKTGDNNEFIERYICIGFPTRIRLVLIALPLAVLFRVLIDVFTGGIDRALYEFLFYIVFLGSFYWRLNSLIRIAAH
jgi:hypothetical protein